jgi:hypothetical protein
MAMGAKRCDEDLTEVLCDLAHAIRDQTKVAQAQFEWFQSHLNCVTVQQLQSELGKVKEIIMAGQPHKSKRQQNKSRKQLVQTLTHLLSRLKHSPMRSQIKTALALSFSPQWTNLRQP